MKRFTLHTRAGRLDLLLEDRADLEETRDLALFYRRSGTSFGGQVLVGRRDGWMKSSFLRGRARLRHSLSQIVWRAPLPRMREVLNACWLEKHSFQVPHPIAAGWFGGEIASWQFMISEFVAGTPLDVVLRASDESQRATLLTELAQETARMHALGFVHRDLFWRNVLVGDARNAKSLIFLDAWRGGERLQLRTPAYDLACLFLEGPSLLREDEIRLWLAEYAKSRASLGKPVDERRMWRTANAARNALLARVRREPGRWRVPEPPVQGFDFDAVTRSGSNPALP